MHESHIRKRREPFSENKRREKGTEERSISSRRRSLRAKKTSDLTEAKGKITGREEGNLEEMTNHIAQRNPIRANEEQQTILRKSL